MVTEVIIPSLVEARIVNKGRRANSPFPYLMVVMVMVMVMMMVMVMVRAFFK